MEIWSDFVKKILFTGLMKKKTSNSSGNIDSAHIDIKRIEIRINGENNLKRN